MKIRHLRDCAQFIANDNSHLREIINPRKENLRISYSLAWATVAPGKKTLRHKLTYAEVYYITKGKGIMHINYHKKSVREKDTIYVPPHAVQCIENTGKLNLEFLCIVEPAWKPRCEEIIP